MFNGLKNRFSKEKRKKTREKFYGREMISKYYKELERENILKNEEKKVKKFKMNRRKNIKKNKRRNTT